MDRVVCHWSEGNYEANAVDLRAYHVLIEGDGRVVFGRYSIADNASTADKVYAAHTRGLNTRSIGVACCCMVGCQEMPFQAGAKPLKKLQWDRMVAVVADLCEFYEIPVSAKTVLGHGEVQSTLGVAQSGKWDPMVWPWDATTHGAAMGRGRVGDALRSQVAALRAEDGAAGGGEPTLVVAATVMGGAVSTHLRSALFTGQADLEAIADGHRVLKTNGQPEAGVGTVQDGLNRLADSGADTAVDLGPKGNWRGWFGQRTERAVKAFQRLGGLREDGEVGENTIVSLDEALVRVEAGDVALGVVPVPVLAVPATASAASAAAVAPGEGGAVGYVPPKASLGALAGIDFGPGEPGPGAHLLRAYAAADASPRAKTDPSRCRALLRFPDGTVFFESKLAICADGSPRAKAIDFPYGQVETSTVNPVGKEQFDAEQVPYVVLPMADKDETLRFEKTFGIGPLDLAVVVYKDGVTPAIFADRGPFFRLGEGSIQLHERLPVPFPWTTPARSRVLNASVPGEVLTFIFPGSAIKATGLKSGEEWLERSLATAMERFRQFASGGSAIPVAVAAAVGASPGEGDS